MRWLQKLRRAGLQPVQQTYANTLLFPVALVRRMLAKFAGAVRRHGRAAGVRAAQRGAQGRCSHSKRRSWHAPACRSGCPASSWRESCERADPRLEALRAARSALVTGGYGFIGSNLVHALVGLGCRVTVVDNLDAGPGRQPLQPQRRRRPRRPALHRHPRPRRHGRRRAADATTSSTSRGATATSTASRTPSKTSTSTAAAH